MLLDSDVHAFEDKGNQYHQSATERSPDGPIAHTVLEMSKLTTYSACTVIMCRLGFVNVQALKNLCGVGRTVAGALVHPMCTMIRLVFSYCFASCHSEGHRPQLGG